MKLSDFWPQGQLWNLLIMVVIMSGVSLVAAPIMAMLPAGGFMGAIVALVLLAFFLWLGKKVGYPDFKEFITLFVAAGAYGTILGTFIPNISGYILAAPQFTITGIAWTLVYIGLAKMVRNIIKL